MREWRDIESAPKDERLLLKRNTTIKEIIIGKLTYGEYGEEEHWQSDCEGPIYPIPTHWMPLPELPKKKHKCILDDLRCIEDIVGNLFIYKGDMVQPVNFCPICGAKSDE